MGRSSPSTRSSGGDGTLRCRSDPPWSIRACRAGWTSNMVLGVGGVWRALKGAARGLDERADVPADELAADEDPADAAKGEERAEGDRRLARLGDARACGD